MALFWHQRLAVSGRMLSTSGMRWMQEYRDILRAEGLGNWRTMLKALTKNGAMLVWLTGLPSNKEAPNENYAREFWELFTLGVDVRYTQADITEAARAFTGWDSRYDASTRSSRRLYFNAEAHDDGSKTILGQTGNYREDDVVDITLATPEAEAVPRPAGLRGARLQGRRARGRDRARAISPVRETGRSSRSSAWCCSAKAFFSAKARKTQVADPVLQMVGLSRAAEIPFESWDLYWNAENMGQVPARSAQRQGLPAGTRLVGRAAAAQSRRDGRQPRGQGPHPRSA